jgi:hypothetical protein
MDEKSWNGIAAFFDQVRFRKKMLGGVDEADVWLKLKKLQEEYETAWKTREQIYQDLLGEKEDRIAELEEQIKGMKAGPASIKEAADHQKENGRQA